MLNSMRSGGNSKVMWVIMGLLMLGLTGFGLGGLGGGTIRSLGAVGDEEVPIATYARGLRTGVQQLSQRAGRNLSPSEIQSTGVIEDVLDAVVGQAAINDETAKLGFSVGDAVVRKNILENPSFQGVNGTFDQATYEFFLERQLGVSPREFDTLLRKESARSIVEGAVVSGLKSDDTIAITLLDFAQQSRSFDWSELDGSLLEAPIEAPTDAQIQTFYDDNADRYMSPLTRNITYAWLNPADMLDQVDVDAAEIRESYDLQLDRFNTPERRAVDRIVFGTLAEAQEAKARLDAEAISFPELLSERGLSERDADLGEVERNSLTKEAGDVVFADATPGIVGPVESSLGPALFRINAIMAADETPLEEVSDELRDELAGERARRLVADQITELDDLLAGGAEVETLAAETDMQLGTIALTIGADDPIAAYDAFREAALAAKPNDFPELIDLSDGGVVTLRLDSIDAPAAYPLADIKDRVTADWVADETAKALAALATELAPQLENGTAWADLGLTPASEDDVQRTSFVEGLPRSAASTVFDLELDKAAVVEENGSVYLVKLTRITPFDPDLPANAGIIDRVTAQMQSQMAFDLLALYTNALKADAGVSINQGALNQVNAQILGNQ